MSVLHAALLGAVQGLTEFIPVSSSGHLVLVPEALDWRAPGLAFDVLLHVASLVALVAYFARDLVAMATGTLSKDPAARRLVLLLAVGSLPAAVAGIALADYFERSFGDARSAAVQLVVTAAILVAAEGALRWHRARTPNGLRSGDELRTTDAAIVGIAQAISILPGISRSGATIGAGLALGVERDAAARFAFLLSIPALFGAALVKIPDLSGTGLGLGSAAVGFTVSLVASYAAIAALIRYLRTRTLYPFAAYCVAAGAFFYAVV